MNPSFTQKFDFNDLFVFEMANNHQGSVAHGKKIINAMALIAKKHNLRAAIKFQFRDLNTFIHPKHLKKTDNKHVPRFLSTALSDKQFKELMEYARRAGFIIIVTPFDEPSVALAEKLGADILKVASSSAEDWPLLEHIASAGKPVIASTGGLSAKDTDNLVSFFAHRYVHFAIMHCVAVYPTPLEKLQLERINIFRKRYPDVVIGYSTHEEPDNFEAIQVAYAKGARIFEKHVGVATDKIKLNAYSASPEQVSKWIESYKRAVLANGAVFGDSIDKNEKRDLELLMRGVFVKKTIKKGKVLKLSDIYFAFPIEPGQLPSGQFKEGMIADKPYKKNEALSNKIKSSYPTGRTIIYESIHDARGMLNEARIPIGIDNNVELSHHYGVERFREYGVLIIDCINREYCKKILVQFPGQKHPVHHHKKKEEAFHILSGELDINLAGRIKKLYPGDVQVIQRGVPHSFWTDIGAIFEEISTTHHNNDSIYEDQAINKMPREERKTKLINWGIHQFD